MKNVIDTFQARIPKILACCLFALSTVLLTGCATYQTKVSGARNYIKQRQPHVAIEKLKPLANKESDDQLVYLFDYGTALQLAGDYRQSNKVFLAAEEIAQVQDYHSISKITASILLSEKLVQYKGEDHENVLLNAMLAINFLMLEDYEAAQVECRKLNNKLQLYITDAKRPYEQNPFAYYLNATIWEQSRNFDSAYIDYERVYKLRPDIPMLKEDLVRAAYLSQRNSKLNKWRKKFPSVKIRKEWRDKRFGELIVVMQQGWGPRKRPHNASPRLPKLYPVYSVTTGGRIEFKDESTAPINRVYSVTKNAVKALNDQYAGLIAKRAVGVAAKAVVADQVRQKNQLLGQLTWIALNAADQADLRHWSTLPESFQVGRKFLKAGKYTIRIQGLQDDGTPSGEYSEWMNVNINPRKKTFVNWRSVR